MHTDMVSIHNRQSIHTHIYIYIYTVYMYIFIFIQTPLAGHAAVH